MSKSEQPTGEAKKLVLRVKTLEAQLRQSVPKKEHQESVTKMQETIDELKSELENTRSELKKNAELNEKLNEQFTAISTSVASQNKSINSQNKAIESLTSRLAAGTVPQATHEAAWAKIRDLEDRVKRMVPREDYAALQRQYDEESEQVRSMVQRSDYSALQSKVDELQNSISTMVPRDQYDSAVAEVRGYESRMANYVPRSEYDELTAKIVSLAEEVTVVPSISEPAPEPEAEEPAIATVEQTQVTDFPATEEAARTEIPIETIVQAPAAIETAPQTITVETPAAAEITEVQHVAPVSASADAAPAPISSAWEPDGFRFAEIDTYAKTGLEFLNDVEKVPVETVASQCRNGDYERWFREYLKDDATADAIRTIGESATSTEDCRSQLIAAVSPRYKAVTN